MNIFATSASPIMSALWLDDKRVIKMCIETAQILSTVAHETGRWADGMYQPTHRHHPCVLWAGRSPFNHSWLLQHGFALCGLYQLLYDREHASKKILYLFGTPDYHTPPPVEFQNSARNASVGVDYSDVNDVHLAYRLYLGHRWKNDRRPPTWGRRAKPEWYDGM